MTIDYKTILIENVFNAFSEYCKTRERKIKYLGIQKSRPQRFSYWEIE